MPDEDPRVEAVAKVISREVPDTATWYSCLCLARDVLRAADRNMWQPIATAPRDGHWGCPNRDIDLWDRWRGLRIADCFWDTKQLAWISRFGGVVTLGIDRDFTHWRPKPQAPAREVQLQEHDDG